MPIFIGISRNLVESASSLGGTELASAKPPYAALQQPTPSEPPGEVAPPRKNVSNMLTSFRTFANIWQLLEAELPEKENEPKMVTYTDGN